MAARRHRGFTLIELMLVLGLISVLMGVGIGFLGRGGSDDRLTWSAIRDQLRMVGETARAEGRPAELRFESKGDGYPIEVRGRVLSDVGHWHFETNERYRRRLAPLEITGRHVPGRFGEGLRPEPTARSAMVTLDASAPQFDLELGFSLQLEVKLDSYERCSLVEFGQGLRLIMDADGSVEAHLVLRGAGGKAGLRTALRSGRIVPLDEWTTIELFCDGRQAQLLQAGMIVASDKAEGSVLQTKQDRILLSPANSPVPGTLDEFKIAAYQQGEPRQLPDSVTMKKLPLVIRFDRRGELEGNAGPTLPIEIEVDGEVQTRKLTSQGLLQ